MGAYLTSIVCPICKKRFVPAPEHVYKIGYTKLVCSWGCVMKWEKAHKKGVGRR